MSASVSYRPLIAAGTALGIGLGGFLDGILFHQILQTHAMLSAKYPRTGLDPAVIVRNLEINMFWDGIFHAFTWAMTVIGLAMLWRVGKRSDVPWSTRTFVGSLPLGWGLFNLVEGVTNHHILHLHHVTETSDHFVFDIAFLGFSVILLFAGIFLIARGADGDSSARARV